MVLFKHLYSEGADYIDILGLSYGPDKQDEITIAVKDEYMNTGDDVENYEETFEMVEPAPSPPPPPLPLKEFVLTDKHIDNLLDNSL